jgi:hypothetical protein
MCLPAYNPVVDGYRFGIRLPITQSKFPKKCLLREDVELHLIPDTQPKQRMEIRIWWDNKMVHSVRYPLIGFRIHL